ncbi:DUF397 domain-containing protein [Streptomyces sp. NPDC091272]|uniref:DUF397 domain-containing protein n=1 Tax=Streptomyces sp. NPDC091272 TaxID=3365981 RepID=UPI00382C1698
MTIINAGALSGADWFKSSYSNDQGGDCVEGARLCAEAVRGMDWHKSSYSNDQGGNCVEGAQLDDGMMMAVRDSKVPDGPAFIVRAEAWTTFVTELTRGAAQ